MNFETFNSQYGEVEIAYHDSKVVAHFTAEQSKELGQWEANEILQEYLDSLDENVEPGGAFEYVPGYWAAQVFDAD